ncbi:glycosyltransferase family 2 protein [Acidiphilium multivorum]|uniref:glycosyltransferase family 2 protein n=1 Tax=Acidiphilium multivorum TaxID=62140 RepID=UPI001F4BE37E|nr:glycosyltransferase family 2 protein [Acidiphilium multivorum]UNC14952.1 glycosyltransferase family 2 protein [Acidiphilium multivorum]
MSNYEDYPAVAIIVLNWNDSKNTIACIESLQRIIYPKFKIYIIDNNSEDNSIENIRKIFPYIEIYNSGSNLGWAGGNNYGIKLAKLHGYNYFYLINPDIRVEPKTLSALVEAIDAEDVAAVGSVVISYSNPDWLEFAGSQLTSESGFSRQTSMKKSEFVFDGPDIDVPELKGCSFLITEKGFDKIGYFDERYFLNYDETDWCFRARSNNMRCVFSKKSICFHIGAQTFGGVSSPLYRYFIARNRIFFARKNLDKKSLIFAWRCMAWEIKSVLLGRSIEKRGLKVKGALLLSLFLSLRDAIFNRYGNCPPLVRKINKV